MPDTVIDMQPRRTTAPTREDLLRRAEKLVPVLAERSARCEQTRRCPDETIADYVSEGLLKICQPARYGGWELGYDVMCEVIQILAHGCASQAWVQMVLADNPLKMSAFSLEAQDEVWSRSSDQKICVAVAAVGKAREVAGGVVWTGTHGFSSGIDHADWVICGGHILKDGEAARGCFVVIPRHEIRIIDDWHTIGLSGTGSKSFAVEQVFVPSHRVLDKKDYDAGTAPGTLFYKSAISKLPRGGVSAVSYTAAAVGAAEGFLANYIAMTAGRKSRGHAVAEEAGIQINIGLASAEIEAAQRMYIGAIRETMQALERGEKISRQHNLAGKRNACFAAQLAMQAVQRLFNNAGGRALFTDNVLQRQWRDCYAASAHHSLVWETAAANYGRHVLGVGEKRN